MLQVAAERGARAAAWRIGPNQSKSPGLSPGALRSWIDQYRTNLLTIAQSEVLPGMAPIRGLIDSVSDGKVRPTKALSTAYVNHVWI